METPVVRTEALACISFSVRPRSKPLPSGIKGSLQPFAWLCVAIDYGGALEGAGVPERHVDWPSRPWALKTARGLVARIEKCTTFKDTTWAPPTWQRSSGDLPSPGLHLLSDRALRDLLLELWQPLIITAKEVMVTWDGDPAGFMRGLQHEKTPKYKRRLTWLAD